MFIYDDAEPTTLGGETWDPDLDKWGEKWGIPRRGRADLEYRLAIIGSVERFTKGDGTTHGVRGSYRDMIEDLRQAYRSSPSVELRELLRSLG